MHGSLICASKFKSVCNKPAVVCYQEHCIAMFKKKKKKKKIGGTKQQSLPCGKVSGLNILGTCALNTYRGFKHLWQ